jgi:hypothetical protein
MTPADIACFGKRHLSRRLTQINADKTKASPLFSICVYRRLSAANILQKFFNKLLLFSLALAPLAAQTLPVRAVSKPVAAVAEQSVRIPQSILATLETNFDSRLAVLDAKDPVDMLGDTRALYLPGYGTVFTSYLSLIVTPGTSPFRPVMSDADIKQVHARKLAHLPTLEALMKEMVTVIATTLNGLPDDQKVTLVVRMRYYLWEDTNGLPAQIVMTAEKKSAKMGDIKTEVE